MNAEDPREKNDEAMGPIALYYFGVCFVAAAIYAIWLGFNLHGEDGLGLFGFPVAMAIVVGGFVHIVESKTYRYRDSRRRGNWPPVSWWNA